MTQPPDVASATLRQALIDLAIECWRFARSMARLLARAEAADAARHANQLRYFTKRVEESLVAAGVRLVNLEGEAYDAGMAVSALNIGDFGADEVLVVDQMVEPVILGDEGVVRSGTVMLRRVDA